MKGIRHEVSVIQPDDGLEPDYGLTGPAVQMHNTDDAWYNQVFENWNEINVLYRTT